MLKWHQYEAVVQFSWSKSSWKVFTIMFPSIPIFGLDTWKARPILNTLSSVTMIFKLCAHFEGDSKCRSLQPRMGRYATYIHVHAFCVLFIIPFTLSRPPRKELNWQKETEKRPRLTSYKRLPLLFFPKQRPEQANDILQRQRGFALHRQRGFALHRQKGFALHHRIRFALHHQIEPALRKLQFLW